MVASTPVLSKQAHESLGASSAEMRFPFFRCPSAKGQLDPPLKTSQHLLSRTSSITFRTSKSTFKGPPPTETEHSRPYHTQVLG